MYLTRSEQRNKEAVAKRIRDGILDEPYFETPRFTQLRRQTRGCEASGLCTGKLELQVADEIVEEIVEGAMEECSEGHNRSTAPDDSSDISSPKSMRSGLKRVASVQLGRLYFALMPYCRGWRYFPVIAGRRAAPTADCQAERVDVYFVDDHQFETYDADAAGASGEQKESQGFWNLISFSCPREELLDFARVPEEIDGMAVPFGGLDHATAQSIAWKKLWKAEPQLAERIFDGSDYDTTDGEEEEEEEEEGEIEVKRPHAEEEEEAIPPRKPKALQADDATGGYEPRVGSYYDLISQYGQKSSTPAATDKFSEGVPPKSTSSLVWSSYSQDYDPLLK